jgi:hypothetical protein
MLKLTPLGANALHDIIGCGIPTVVDYDSTHKDATRYRLHVDAVYEDGLTGSRWNRRRQSRTTRPRRLWWSSAGFRQRHSSRHGRSVH